MTTRSTSRQARVRLQPRLRLRPLVGAALTLGMACSADDRDPITASPAQASLEPEAGDPSNPEDGNTEAPGEARSAETPPPGGESEGPPTNVGRTPTSMEDAVPPGADPAADDSAVDEPAADEPAADEPAEDEPAVDEPAEDAPPATSAGCGSTATVQEGRLTIDVAGTSREYILEVPDDYDPNHPYRLIFGWHWQGGTAQQVADGFYGLEQRAQGSAIFVSAEGIGAGWANTGGRDIAFLDAMLDRIQGELCIDQSRIFSTGWSYGGMMSLAVGCARGEVFRAIAPMSGAMYSGCEDGDAPVAFLGYHGNNDTVVPYGNGVAARNEFVARNGCQPESAALEVDGCLQFQGCTEGAPLTWCEFNGGHTPGPGSEQAIWDFFSQF